MLAKNEGKAVRAGLILTPIFLVGILFGFLNFYSILAFAILVLSYILFRQKLWILLVAAVPVLALGTIVYFPLTINWTYEATLSEVLIMLAGIIYFSDAFINGEWKKMKPDFIAGILIAYLLISFASFLHIEDFHYFVFGMKIPVYAFLGYFLAKNLLDEKSKIDVFLKGIGLLTAILSAQLLWKFYTMGFSPSFMLDRSHITIAIGAIATVAAILVLMLPVVLAIFYGSKEKEKPLLFLVVMVGVSAVLLTLGKAAIGSLVVGLGFFYFRHQEKRNDFVLFSFLILVSGMMFLSSFFEGLWERLSNAFSDVNSRYRVFELEVSWKVAKENILFGVGSGQQLAVFKRLMNVESPQLINNFFVQFLVDLGIVGLGLVLILIGAIIKKIRAVLATRKNQLIVSGLLASFVAVFLNGLAEVTFFALPFALIFWPMMGVFANLEKQYE